MPGNVDSVILELQAKLGSYNADVAGAANATEKNLARIQTSASTTEKAVGHAFNNTRISQQILQHVARSTADSFAAGTPPMMIFTTHLGQLAEAGAYAGGSLGKVGAFLGGPWGIAATFAVTALIPLIGKLFEAGDGVDELVEKLQDHFQKSQASARANEIFGNTIEGVTQALADNKKALESLNLIQDTSAEKALEVARAEEKKADKIRKSTEAMLQQAIAAEKLLISSTASGSGVEGAGAQAAGIQSAQARIADLQKLLDQATQQGVEAARQVVAAHAAVSVETGMQSAEQTINRLYDKRIADAEALAIKEGKVGDALTKQTQELQKQRQIALDGLKEIGKQHDTADQTRFTSPVSGGRVTGSFGESRPGHQHAGLDIAVPVGTQVSAPAAGVVIEAGTLPGYGNVVFIDHGRGTITRLAHLSSIDVAKGQAVQQGQVIGLSGGAKGASGAGDSTGPHVHYEVRVNGKAVDPSKGLFNTDAVAIAEKVSDAAEKAAEAERKAAEHADQQYATTARRIALEQELGALRASGNTFEAQIADWLESDAKIEADNVELVRSNNVEQQKRLQLLKDQGRAAIDLNYATKGSLIGDIKTEDLQKQVEKLAEVQLDAQKRAADELHARQEDQVRTLAGLYEDLFTGGTKSIWSDFKHIGLQVISEVLARFTIGNLLGGGGVSLGGALSAAIGHVLPGFGGSGVTSGAGLFSPGSVAGFASGGSMVIGGKGGTDQNMLSLNGSPLARVSAGEILNIANPRLASSGQGNGSIVIEVHAVEGQMFETRVAGIADGRAVRVVQIAAPSITQAAVSETFRQSSRPKM